jgi:hypothetical protein
VTLPHRTPGESGLRPIVLPLASLADLENLLATDRQKGIAMLTLGPEDQTDDREQEQEQEQEQPESEPHVANPF